MEQFDIYLARLVEELYVRGVRRGRVKTNMWVFLFVGFLVLFFEPVDGGLDT